MEYEIINRCKQKTSIGNIEVNTFFMRGHEVFLKIFSGAANVNALRLLDGKAMWIGTAWEATPLELVEPVKLREI
jgi:hypothetical protein